MKAERRARGRNCYLCECLEVELGSAFCLCHRREVTPSEARTCEAFHPDGQAVGGWGDVIPQTLTVSNKYGQVTVRI